MDGRHNSKEHNVNITHNESLVSDGIARNLMNTRMERHIITRSQHSRGSSSGMFGGPDHYMAVVTVPDGVKVGRTPLTRATVEKRGWALHYIGEYYSAHTGPRSTCARLVAEAEALGATWE